MFVSNEERKLAMRARLDTNFQNEYEWPTSLFATESRFCEHEFVDHSYGGPDSGLIDITCKKCGYNHYAALY